MQLRNNPKVMVIKDVIKELSKVQKDKGTLVHEIISENCFTFFSDAMKIAKEKDLLGTIYILRKHIFRPFGPTFITWLTLTGIQFPNGPWVSGMKISP